MKKVQTLLLFSSIFWISCKKESKSNLPNNPILGVWQLADFGFDSNANTLLDNNEKMMIYDKEKKVFNADYTDVDSTESAPNYYLPFGNFTWEYNRDSAQIKFTYSSGSQSNYPPYTANINSLTNNELIFSTGSSTSSYRFYRVYQKE